MKTNKTLSKRVRITKNGKIMRKQVGNRHLKVKKTGNNQLRKNRSSLQVDKGQMKKIKTLLAKKGKRI